MEDHAKFIDNKLTIVGKFYKCNFYQININCTVHTGGIKTSDYSCVDKTQRKIACMSILILLGS